MVDQKKVSSEKMHMYKNDALTFGTLSLITVYTRVKVDPRISRIENIIAKKCPKLDFIFMFLFLKQITQPINLKQCLKSDFCKQYFARNVQNFSTNTRE